MIWIFIIQSFKFPSIELYKIFGSLIVLHCNIQPLICQCDSPNFFSFSSLVTVNGWFFPLYFLILSSLFSYIFTIHLLFPNFSLFNRDYFEDFSFGMISHTKIKNLVFNKNFCHRPSSRAIGSLVLMSSSNLFFILRDRSHGWTKWLFPSRFNA